MAARSRGNPGPADRLLALVGLAGFLGAWELLASGLVAGVPTASATVARLGLNATDADFWRTVARTLLHWSVGLGATVAVAVPAGLAIGASHRAYRLTQSTIDFARAVPPIILLPVFVLVLGTGLDMVTLLVLYGATWPLLIHTIAGVRDVDALTLDTARVFRLKKALVFLLVLLPAALPFILTGLRISAAIALFVAVACELVAGSPGVGRQIAQSQLTGDVQGMYALVLTAGLLGMAINAFFGRLEARTLSWHDAQGAGRAG